VRAGRVSVNGAIARDPARRVDPRRDRILVDGLPLGAIPAAATAAVLALHKPRGPLVTRSDPEGRPTVFDLLPRDRGLLRCVGRLDGASAGLLLATTDTALAAALEDPASGVERVYRVKVRPRVDAAALAAILRGTIVDGKRAAPRSVSVESHGPRSSRLRVVLAEGRNREIRRICAAAGREVETLLRVAYGPVELGDLAPGAWRDLRPEEVAALRRAAPGPRPGGTPPRRRSR
jgi:23S rRNA pseudouridine2605 synthase